MIRFSIGISLFVLSIIIGTTQYFSNKDLISNAQTRYERTVQQVREVGQFADRLERAKELAIERGQDQRARIESTLGLRDIGLQFEYTSSPRPDAPESRYFFRHEFHISGQARFFEFFSLLNRIENTPGFIINYVCVKCENINIPDPEEGKVPISIRGYLNVYHPEQV